MPAAAKIRNLTLAVSLMLIKAKKKYRSAALAYTHHSTGKKTHKTGPAKTQSINKLGIKY